MAQQRATMGIGIIVGTAMMLLTLIWGLSVILGSYDLSDDPSSNDPQAHILKGALNSCSSLTS